MKNKNFLLLKGLLLSTSRINQYKHCKDKKKKKKIAGGFIGVGILYLMLMAYCIGMCIGYGEYGLIDSVPAMCAGTISVLAFVFTLFKTNGYLFNFKEYDMLMSLPFKTSSVAGCKFLYMYINSLPWFLSISLSMIIGYGIYAAPKFYVYPLWIILALIIPIIPMLLSAFIGFLIAKVSSGFKNKTIIQTVLTVIFVLFCFAARFFMEDMFRNNKVQATLESVSGTMDNVSEIYLPIGWFSKAVINDGILETSLLVGTSVILFGLTFFIVGRSYRKINSNLKSHAAAKNYKMSKQKKSSILNAIAFKEFKRMTGSSVYLTNGAMGMIFSLIVGIVALVIGPDKLDELVLKAIPDGISILRPAIPFISYFFIGMFATTTATPSLEGKNYWIVQSLPIEKKKLYQGKMLFNMYITVPFMIFTTLSLCIVTRTPIIDTVLYIILSCVMCAFSTTWGCVCGIKHMKLDWENEIEVIKQSSAVVIYMFPNMFGGMILGVIMVLAGRSIEHSLLIALLILVFGLLTSLCYRKSISLAKKSRV